MGLCLGSIVCLVSVRRRLARWVGRRHCLNPVRGGLSDEQTQAVGPSRSRPHSPVTGQRAQQSAQSRLPRDGLVAVYPPGQADRQGRRARLDAGRPATSPRACLFNRHLPTPPTRFATRCFRRPCWSNCEATGEPTAPASGYFPTPPRRDRQSMRRTPSVDAHDPSHVENGVSRLQEIKNTDASILAGLLNAQEN